MRLSIIALFLITVPVNSIYPHLRTEVETNPTSNRSKSKRYLESVNQRFPGKKTPGWKHYNKFIKKLVRLIENIDGLDGSQCLVDLTSLLYSASTVLAAAPNCALFPHQNSQSDLPCWKLWVVDSWPRIPSGLTTKDPLFFFGDYDICRSRWLGPENTTSEELHYCRAKFRIYLQPTSTTVTIGFCLPISCSVNDVEPLAMRFVGEFIGISEKDGAMASVENVVCHGRYEEWPYLKKVLIAIALSMLLLLLAATLTDNYLVNREASKFENDVGDGFTFSGSGKTDYAPYHCQPSSNLVTAFVENDALRRTNCFEAPSVALTYKDAPALSHSITEISVLLDALRCFSLRVSLRHLSRRTAKEIPCLNGLKVISTIWVIFGHSCLFTLPYMDNLNILVSAIEKSQWFIPILLNSSLAVDSFLFISGTVAAFSLRKRILFRSEYDSSVCRFAHRSLMFYFHRITRLWPSVLISTLFIGFVYNHLGDGPMWSTKGFVGTTCSSVTMWPHLLFLSNWYPSSCQPWLWYAALNFQLHLVSPILLAFLPRYPRFATGFGVLLVICSIAYISAIYIQYPFTPNIFANVLNVKRIVADTSSVQVLYVSPIARSAPFLIGLLTGWKVSVRSKTPTTATTTIFFKIFALSLLFAALFGPFYQEGPLLYAHAILHRTLWSVALAIIVWLCENGLAPEISFFLSSPQHVLFSRLSLGIYLTHEPILLFYIWTSRQPHSPRSVAYFIIFTLITFILSLFVALVLAVTIEIPILSMEKKLLKTNYQQNDADACAKQAICEETNAEVDKPVFHEEAATWLCSPKTYGLPYHDNQLAIRPQMSIMRCSSAFSMHTCLWRQYSRCGDDASQDGMIVGNEHRGPDGPLLKQGATDLELWERTLYSTC